MWQLSYAPLGDQSGAWHKQFDDQPAARLALGDIVLGFDGQPAAGRYYLAAPDHRIVASWTLHQGDDDSDSQGDAITLYRHG